METNVKKLFSTEVVHPRDRFDYWHEVACKNIVEHNSRPECRHSFKADIDSGMLADIGILCFRNTPMDVSRTTRHIGRARADSLFICRQVAGTLALQQESREITLKAGDLTLVDPMLPYAGRFSAGSTLLLLKVPSRALETRVGATRGMVARLIKPQEAENSLTSDFLAMLPASIGRMNTTAEHLIRDQVLDMIAMSLSKTMEGRAAVSSMRALASLNVRTAIETRLADPALDAATVAAAAGISVRYANAVLADEQTSIRRLIRARRLERCRKTLEDPRQAHRTVSEIAYGWGFSDMTHFGRSFKKAYGRLPSEYRKLARRSDI
jgi:AraC family transcriptional activator of tynA and feaB